MLPPPLAAIKPTLPAGIKPPPGHKAPGRLQNSVVVLGRAQVFGTGQRTHQPGRVVNEHRQVLRTDPEGRVEIGQLHEWCGLRAPLAGKTSLVG